MQDIKKVKLSLCLINYALSHEDVWGSRCIHPPILDLGTSWRQVVSFTARSLYPRGKDPGTHFIGSWVDPRIGLHDVKKRKNLHCRDSNFDHSAVQPVASRYTD
jgi:hypothetical protein